MFFFLNQFVSMAKNHCISLRDSMPANVFNTREEFIRGNSLICNRSMSAFVRLNRWKMMIAMILKYSRLNRLLKVQTRISSLTYL